MDIIFKWTWPGNSKKILIQACPLSGCQLWIEDDDGEIYGVNIEHVVVINENIETLKIADEFVGKDQNEILGNWW